MSTHSFTKIDQKEYLKKYLSGDKVKKKKKGKKHKSTSSAKVKIIDDDVHHFDNGQEIDEELLLTGEDAPQIVGEYIEERPAESKVLKWKSIVIKDEPEDVRDTSTKNDANLWGSKAAQVRVKHEIAKGKKRSNRSPINSPPRRNNRSSSLSPSGMRYNSNSPQRKTKRENSSTRYRKNSESPNQRVKIKPEPQSTPTKKQVLSPIQRQRGRENSFDILSPPRRRRNSDQSPPRKGKSSASRDQSPPRHRRNFNQSPSSSIQSPARKDRKRLPHESQNRHTKEFDQSPIRKGKSNFQMPRRHSPDQSSPRQKRYSYQSPPRRNKSPARKDRKRSPDHSPPRRKNKYDQSPLRTRRNSDHSSPSNPSLDQSPPRRRRNSDSNRSPQRCSVSLAKKERKKLDSDQLPLKREKSPDQSPPRRRRNSDLSPPRRRRNSDHSPTRRSKNSPTTSQKCFPDNSPPRRKRESPPLRIKREKQISEFSPPTRRSRWEKLEQEKSLSPPPSHKPKPGKTLDGKKAGLQDAKALQKETSERRRHEDHLFEKMSSEISGRNAEVQVRSTGRRGRRAREAAEEDPEERKRKDEHEQKKKQMYDRWGKGLKQIEDHKNRMIEQEYESSKPLARYSNDEDLERHLKEQERAEDPMLHYMRQKRKEKEKQSGKPEIPRYEGPFPENRFGIRPGYRWDGVDRSNGYEMKYFAVQNEKRARQDEAYKYSVEDM